MPKKLIDMLKSEADANERKKQAMFDVIHVLSDHLHPPILNDEEIVEALLEKGEVETKDEAWQGLQQYIWHLYEVADDRHLKVITGLATRGENARLKRARMCNRIEEQE